MVNTTCWYYLYDIYSLQIILTFNFLLYLCLTKRKINKDERTSTKWGHSSQYAIRHGCNWRTDGCKPVFNQPLLENMRQSLGATELQTNLITFITQLGYAAGLVLIVPLADNFVLDATNRSNTIFMSHLFAGGSLGTLCAGVAWNYGGWNAICLIGFLFAFAVALVSFLFNRTQIKNG